MYAGDSRNCLESVRREMRRIKYPVAVDYSALLRGQQSGFIEIYRYLFSDFCPSLTKWLSDKGFDLTGMADKKFMESVYRCIRDILVFKPSITLTQFFSSGFAERKMDMLVTVCQKMLSQRDSISKSVVQKSVHTRSILETVNRRRLKEKEPEIIEISPPRTKEKSPTSTKRVRAKVIAAGDSRQNPGINDIDHSPNHDFGRIIQDGGHRLLVDEMESSPATELLNDAETQTNRMSNVKLLEDISTKLDNIVARITVLESRMSVIENRMPPDVNNEYQEKEGHRLTSPFANASELLSERLTSDIYPSQQRRPIEAVVINQTNQSIPAVKSMRFYDRGKENISLSSNLNGAVDVKAHCPGQYSPSLYRLDPEEGVQEIKVPSDDVSDGSDVTSEDFDASEHSPIVSSEKWQSSRNQAEQENPVKLSDTLQESEDTLQSQVTRIQEMINSTNVLLGNIE